MPIAPSQSITAQFTEAAFSLLRPVLQELKVQELKRVPSIVRASNHGDLVTAGMERWIIIARRTASLGRNRGCTVIALDKTNNLLLVVINIDEQLFVNDGYELRKQRKMIAVHEFVHGAAHMFMYTFLRPKFYIESMRLSVTNMVKMTTSEEFVLMLSTIGQLGSKDRKWNQPFSDGHFRLFGDGTPVNYSELYINFLLSYQLIMETMTGIKLYEENIDISKLITLAFNYLADKKALDKEFVITRIKTFLPSIFDKFA